MLPTVLTQELREGIEAFLRSTFPTSTPAFRGAFDEILNGTGRDKPFRGPWLRIGLPFQPGKSDRNFFSQFQTVFPPYVHQEQAWERLRDPSAKSTLVATGTGSGKTECFTYPVFDHILLNPAQRGIKAIILYPMNALATDQARRFAKEIHENPAFNGKIRVGLYVGGLESGKGSKSMSETGVITDRDEMRKSPPDILLTNYKMLDYLLIRQDDRGIWEQNQADTLRYLVVDELHTFDGAQGTDLACLIRRVKARLKTPENHLCCVGTSATLGGPDSGEAMVDFAEMIFGEAFENSPVIQEARKSVRDHLDDPEEHNYELLYFQPPGPESKDDLSSANFSSIESYIAKQTKLWFGRELPVQSPKDRAALAKELRRHNFLRTFLGYFKGQILEEEVILADLAKRYGQWDETHHRLLINSFVSLCAIARDAPHSRAYFLQIRAELWMRELRRMVASVSPQPMIRFSMDLPADHPQKHLAAMHCRDCGAMGWGSLQKANEDRLIPELDRFYQAFFSRNPDPRLRFVFPRDENDEQATSLVEQYLCGACLSLFESSDGKCPDCGTLPCPPSSSPENSQANISTFRVESHIRTIQRQEMKVADKSCPYCDSSTGLTIVGSQSASLISVGLSQLYGSPYNDDKKAMAFSDSVQDASHRAGFFTGRTYQIALRTALYQVIDSAKDDVSVAELAEQFPEHWLGKLNAEDFVGTFMPPNAEWMSEFEKFKEARRLPQSSPLPMMVRDRMNWEVIREFGLQCRIGRTLEKSGAAACYLSPDLIAKCAKNISKKIRDISAVFSEITDEDLARLIAATSERLRANGGLYHPFLDSYLEKKGDTWIFNNQIAGGSLPAIRRQGQGRRPTFFASFAMKDTFERLIASGSTKTWTERWLEKWLILLCGDKTKDLTLAPIIEILVEGLQESGLWLVHEANKSDKERSWSLNPEHLLISREVLDLACDQCGHQLSVGACTEDLWQGTPCLRHQCDGLYQPSTVPSESYFGDLYRKGNVIRLRASEHTGMLDRETREQIESEFMSGASMTDTNLLSCTPTMEMGVDVGDLSTVLLCSVPPAQSNYLQRVGRGGRRDGNSLALTVANSDAHDLSYYEEPLDMMAGDVELPAIFLRAPAVLERQLTAYCIDRWIENNASTSIPKQMEAIYILLANQNKEQKGKNGAVFPNSFYHYIESNLTELITGFVAMFSRNELNEESIDYLKAFIQGNDDDDGSLAFKINRSLAASFKDRDGLFEKRIKLNKSIQKNKKREPRDEKLDLDLAHMIAERKAISRVIQDMNRKHTLNFLTDEGLIPNYAFPEEGVTLRSVILKKPDKSNRDDKLIKLEFEHMRPAEAAITELAPGSSFYVEGRKLTIDQVSIDQDDYEQWHFCRSCSHLEPVSNESESYSECPRCHCSGWSDASLRHHMLKMRQVFVTAWDRNVRNLDQKDDRDLATFNKQTSINYEANDIRKSYQLKAEGATFAFDFIDRITLRETNFGEDQHDEDALQIGGKTLHGVGFRVCTSCGKIQTRFTREEHRHHISCSFYGSDAPEEDFEDTFLLYRQLESEAIKLLIPALSQDENIDTQSFVAAIHLGLKKKFGGQLSHLKLSVQNQPIAGSSLRVQHVFIYDGVPGGTGYLKDLTRSDKTLLEVLELACDALESCNCKNDPNLDGCYQCIKAYRFRYVNNQISRTIALKQLKRILDNKDAIEERSPDESLINPLLESELERKFIESLRQTEGFIVNQEVVEGKPGYLLRIGDTAWNIIPQVELGPKNNVSVPCRPDFLMKPLRACKGLPIAVFLDGFAFHADVEAGNNRIADDIKKRNAIRMSGKYLVWSLTWADLKGQKSPENAFLAKALPNINKILKEHAPDLADRPVFSSANWNGWDLLQHFLHYLAESQIADPVAQWQTAAAFTSCNFPTRAPTDEKNLTSALEYLIQGNIPSLNKAQETRFMASLGNVGGLRSVSAVPIESLQKKRFDGALSALWFDDTGNVPMPEFQAEWQELLRSYNLLQFAPRFICITKILFEKGDASNLLDWLIYPDDLGSKPIHNVSNDTMSEEHIEELELLDPLLQPILTPLLSAGSIPWPEFGYEAVSSAGQCGSSMLEVAWPERKLGIVLPQCDPAQFEAIGWTVLPCEKITSELILNRINKQS